MSRYHTDVNLEQLFDQIVELATHLKICIPEKCKCESGYMCQKCQLTDIYYELMRKTGIQSDDPFLKELEEIYQPHERIAMTRVDIKAILKDPAQRKELIAGAVEFLKALEAPEKTGCPGCGALPGRWCTCLTINKQEHKDQADDHSERNSCANCGLQDACTDYDKETPTGRRCPRWCTDKNLVTPMENLVEATLDVLEQFEGRAKRAKKCACVPDGKNGVLPCQKHKDLQMSQRLRDALNEARHGT